MLIFGWLGVVGSGFYSKHSISKLYLPYWLNSFTRQLISGNSFALVLHFLDLLMCSLHFPFNNQHCDMCSQVKLQHDFFMMLRQLYTETCLITASPVPVTLPSKGIVHWSQRAIKTITRACYPSCEWMRKTIFKYLENWH